HCRVPGNVLPDLCRLRGHRGERQERHGHVPRHRRGVGDGRHGHDLRRRPRLRRAHQPRRQRRLRHLRPVPLEEGPGVHAGADGGRDDGEPGAAPDVRAATRARLGDGAGARRLHLPVARVGVHHHLLPHVRRHGRGHRRPSGRADGRARGGRNHHAQRAVCW
ncbi:hypothetical protein ACJX0J_037399, partial [Zea mays]